MIRYVIYKNSIIKILSVFLILLVFSSCEKKKYDDNRNTEEGIRIISLTPSITQELLDLGLKENIVGATSFCDITKDNKDLIVGSAVTVNVEKVLLLHPDIVFTSGLTKDKTISTLKNNGVKVIRFGKMKSFDDICDHFIKLAGYVHKKDIAEVTVKQSRAKIDSLVATVPKHTNSLKVFFQVGTKPIFAVIPNTFMNDYITFSGCKNVLNDFTRVTLGRETVLNRNPDIIFIISMGAIGDKEKEKWKSYPELNAAKSNKIFIVDANIAASPTVLSFTKALEIIINDIYKR
jgi:iron complex transport system substrate-binding protein